MNIRKVGIIGEGKMGTGIFNYLLDYGFTIYWIGSQEADTAKMEKSFRKKIDRARENGILDETSHQRLIAETYISGDLNDLMTCDLVIEAIPEVLDLKRSLFLKLNALVLPSCILASNSSSINPSNMLPSPSRNTTFVGLHFFYPVPLKNIVELVVTDLTSDATILTLQQFLEEIRKRYLLLNEKNSFLLNKLFLDFQNEAFRIVNDGHISMEMMDNLVRVHFFPIGVFEFFDNVGNDTMLEAIVNYTKDYPHKDYYFPLIHRLESMVKEGKLGLKSRSGFYDYSVPKSEASSSDFPASVIEHLRFSYITSAKRFTAQSHLPIDDMNFAIKEYFGIEKGPFE